MDSTTTNIFSVSPRNVFLGSLVERTDCGLYAAKTPKNTKKEGDAEIRIGTLQMLC